MKKLTLVLSVLFILFWLYVVYLKLVDFDGFKREIHSQVFPTVIADVLPYLLLHIWVAIAGLLAFHFDKFYGMLINFVMLLAFTVYVGLAVLEVYAFKPCSCAGLFHFNWEEQFYFNLIVTAVAATGLIITYKDKERRKAVWTR